MSSQAEYNFADWYRPVDNQLTGETQTKRITAITALMDNEDQAFWLDTIRLFINIPVKAAANKTAFIKAFKDEDSVFPVSGNDHLLQVLAGILLCFRLEKFADLNTFISLAILNVNFLGQYNDDSHVPTKDYASQHLLKESKELRDMDLDAHIDAIAELSERKDEDDYEFAAADHIVSVDAISALLHSQKVLSEESNILWWFFGEGSIIFQDSFKNIGLPKSIAIIPKELFDILEFDLGPLKIKSLIQKAISAAHTGKAAIKDYSPFELINKFEKYEKTLILAAGQTTSEFTPILAGLQQSLLFDKNADWSANYSQAFHTGDLKKLFSPSFLATQIFSELLFLKSLN